MSEHLSLGMRWAPAVCEGEAQARALKRAAEPQPWGDEQATYEWWVSTLGASEIEFREMLDDLGRRYKGVSFWRCKQRRAILRDYARLHGFLTAAQGLTVVWR